MNDSGFAILAEADTDAIRHEDFNGVDHLVVPVIALVEGVLVDGVISEEERAFLDKHAEGMALDTWVKEEIEKVGIALRKGALGDAEE